MAGLTFQKATKERIKLRMAVFGPSGAGKTYTSLRIAAGMGGKIAVIDTERGSASRYADRFDYDVLELPETDIETYIAGMAAAHSYDVLIIDSLSHAWQALLEEIDRLAKTKYRGNTWSAWSEGTPKQRSFVDALLCYPGHVIATMRSKTEWSIEKDSRSDKTKPVRVGLAPEQGKGIEYEFDVLMEMNVEHFGTVIKDRTGKFQDRIIEKPGESFGKEIVAWLSEGAGPQDGDQHERGKTQSQPPSKTDDTTNGEGDKQKHWIDSLDTQGRPVRNRFWAYTNEMGLTNDQVHKALGVESVRDYAGSMADARKAIDDWVDAQVKAGEMTEAEAVGL
jgi:hypothetical protein